jgi:hypothetical protein
MNVKKVIKKIVSLGAVGLLVGSTMTGALAMGLENLPGPFVEDGQSNFNIVLGQGAAIQDVLGSIDIATAMQSASYNEEIVEIPGQSTIEIEGGKVLSTSGNSLLLKESLGDAVSSLDDNDLPILLNDGEVSDVDGDDFEYEQKLKFADDITVEFNADDSDLDDPVLYLDTDNGNGVLWEYNVDFKGSKLDALELNDSETIEMLGLEYTFDSKIDTDSDITLYGSKEVVSLDMNSSETITVGSKEYELKVVGANTDDDKIILMINGKRKTVIKGDSYTIDGLEVYVKDTFVTDIPVLDASIDLFVGSQELILGKATSAEDYNDVELNGDTVSGFSAWVEGTDNTDIKSINFRYMPSRVDDDDVEGFDEVNFIQSGDNVTDPVFSAFNIDFVGPNYEFDDEDAKTVVEFKAGDDDLELTFTNDDGDDITFTPFVVDDNNKLSFDQESYVGKVKAIDSLTEEDIFVLNEGTSTKTTYLYEVQDVDDDVVELKNLMTGSSDEYSVGDEIVDDVEIDDISGGVFSLTKATSNVLYVDGGYQKITLPNGTPEVEKTIVVQERNRDEAKLNTFNISMSVDDGDIELRTNGFNDTISDSDQDDGSDTEYTITQYGTYVVADVDDYSEVKVWLPMDGDYETNYQVVVAPTGARKIITEDGQSIKTQSVNPIAVGTAVMDVDINLATTNKNLIVVGGPCINSIAAELMGNPASCSEGFEPATALIQLFDLDNGNVAMLVAGYEALETQAACRAVATNNQGLQGNTSVLSVTNVNTVNIQ